MYIMLTDETNNQPAGNVRFFIYGGLVFPVGVLDGIDAGIREIRAEHGYLPNDRLKFDTNARPVHVTPDSARAAKSSVVRLCSELGCKFIVHVIHHGVIQNQDQNEQVEKAADYVIGRYNRYLREKDSVGLCVIDNIPSRTQWQYLSNKFTTGLEIHGRDNVQLDRIKLFAATCINASHANSAMDIVLGCFRFIVNNPERNVAQEMMNEVAPMMWYREVDGVRNVSDRGLIVRPTTVRAAALRQEYDALLAQVNELLARVPE